MSTLHAPALLGSAGRCFQNSLLFLQIARKQKQNLRYAQMPNIPIMLEQIHTSEQQLQQNRLCDFHVNLIKHLQGFGTPLTIPRALSLFKALGGVGLMAVRLSFGKCRC